MTQKAECSVCSMTIRRLLWSTAFVDNVSVTEINSTRRMCLTAECRQPLLTPGFSTAILALIAVPANYLLKKHFRRMDVYFVTLLYSYLEADFVK
jgi:hypothetical protein